MRDDSRDSALFDYVWTGAREGCSPSALFDEAYYLANNPDVAAAIRAADFVCGFHHYLRNGEGEGRRGVAPCYACVIDASRIPTEAAVGAARFATALQLARPTWRLNVLVEGSDDPWLAMHRWIELDRLPPGGEAPTARVRDLNPDFVVWMSEPASVRPERATVVALGDCPAEALDGLWALADATVTMPGEIPSDDDPGLVGLAERCAATLEAVRHAGSRAGEARLSVAGADGSIGEAATITLPAGTGERVVSIAVDLPVGCGVTKELLQLETGGDMVPLEVVPGRPAHAVVHMPAGSGRIVVRPRKRGYRAVGRIVLARIDSTPLDLVQARTTDTMSPQAVSVIDLNADLARVKREFGRFQTKADTLAAVSPAFEFSVPRVPKLTAISVPRCLIVSTFDAERSWVRRDTVDVSAWREFLDAKGFAVDTLELPVNHGGDAGRLREQVSPEHRFLILTGPRGAGVLTESLERPGAIVRLYRGALSGGRQIDPGLRAADLACARAADRLLVEDPADAVYYRSKGVSAGHIDYLPAFLPRPFRRLVKPYLGRPRQVVVHFETSAVLEGRLRSIAFGREGLHRLVTAGWRVVVSAAPRLRKRIEADLGLETGDDPLYWTDPSVDLPDVLQSTRLVILPAADLAELGGLVTAARTIGFTLLVEGRLDGAGTDRHVVEQPQLSLTPEALERYDRDPGSCAQDAVLSDANRALDRVFGFRGAGWQEGRDDRSPDI
ncbi:MAG: hypothetical protein HQ481_10015 [Alphaproteobacteria bacterium]|nr:hypothetical protein [Alphaproteobacteria bacterium]